MFNNINYYLVLTFCSVTLFSTFKVSLLAFYSRLHARICEQRSLLAGDFVLAVKCIAHTLL